MELLKKPDEDMGMIPVCVITAAWMTGWAFAWWISAHSAISFTWAAATIYTSLAALAGLAVWEHSTYWKHILRINELMHH